MLTVFTTSNEIPLYVHAVFGRNNNDFILHVHCIHLVRGMMRKRTPSIIIIHVGWSDCTDDCISKWTCCGIGHVTKAWSKCGLQEGSMNIQSVLRDREGGKVVV